ncbi:MAG: thiamine pyrophosphate-dependent dehydrogenase E1 component subunit alpha, partial [Desulfobacterales bacterium]
EIKMPIDLWSLYALMLKSRLFEESVTQLWKDGLISGEMHLGTGEEAIIAGVVTHLEEQDAMALDHRGTAAMFMRGVDPILILREMLGKPDGLCGGMGGHMHLFSKPHLAASSGIVGAEGPTAAGFALAAQYLNPDGIAVAFFGEGAMNQGMLMESLNLAAAWRLPVVFVCKDDSWSITTQSDTVTGGDLNDRSELLGVPGICVDGWDVTEVWEAAGQAIASARAGEGPFFLRARCVHFEGHFLGYQLIRAIRHPLREMPKIAVPLTQSFLHTSGASWGERAVGLKSVLSAVLSTLRDPRKDPDNDPVKRTRDALQSDNIRLQALEDEAEREVENIIASAMEDKMS